MPPTFPSHQGLVAPLWRRWPHLFDAPALFIGAAMPDVVDGVIGVLTGRLAQGWGHSLFALPLLCVPGGLLLWWLSRRAAGRLPAARGMGLPARSWNVGLFALRKDGGGQTESVSRAAVLYSLALGSFSHLAIDLVSHGDFRWFYPFWVSRNIFPDWWHIAWYRSPLPIYRDYPLGPHFAMWVLLGGLGAWLLFRPLLRDKTLGLAPGVDDAREPVRPEGRQVQEEADTGR